MALGSAQLLAEMSTMNLPGGKMRAACKADLTAICEPIIRKIRENNLEECFKNWQRRWDRCQALEGDYFEGETGP
jgi:hypothetical protein